VSELRELFDGLPLDLPRLVEPPAVGEDRSQVVEGDRPALARLAALEAGDHGAQRRLGRLELAEEAVDERRIVAGHAREADVADPIERLDRPLGVRERRDMHPVRRLAHERLPEAELEGVRRVEHDDLTSLQLREEVLDVEIADERGDAAQRERFAEDAGREGVPAAPRRRAPRAPPAPW
jgi:hypothetical protein